MMPPEDPLELRGTHDRDVARRALGGRLLAASAIVPSSASAHDATVLAIAAGPPLILAPIVTAVLRGTWLRGTHRRAVPWSRFVAVSVLELVLWLAVAWLAVLAYFEEAWLATSW